MQGAATDFGIPRSRTKRIACCLLPSNTIYSSSSKLYCDASRYRCAVVPLHEFMVQLQEVCIVFGGCYLETFFGEALRCSYNSAGYRHLTQLINSAISQQTQLASCDKEFSTYLSISGLWSDSSQRRRMHSRMGGTRVENLRSDVTLVKGYICEMCYRMCYTDG